MLFDQLVGAGCVARIVAAWVGNVSAGLGHNYRRAVEKRIPAPIAVLDHSNRTLAFGLEAAARGIPYLPTRSLLGTDLLRSNPTFIAFTKRAAPSRATASGSSGGCTAWAH